MKNGTLASPATALAKQRFTGTRRPNKQHALWNLAAEPLKLGWVREEVDNFDQLRLGFFDASNIMQT